MGIVKAFLTVYTACCVQLAFLTVLYHVYCSDVTFVTDEKVKSDIKVVHLT